MCVFERDDSGKRPELERRRENGIVTRRRRRNRRRRTRRESLFRRSRLRSILSFPKSASPALHLVYFSLRLAFVIASHLVVLANLPNTTIMLQNQLSLGMQSFFCFHIPGIGKVPCSRTMQKETSESGKSSVTHCLSCRLCEQQSRKETRTEQSLNSVNYLAVLCHIRRTHRSIH